MPFYKSIVYSIGAKTVGEKLEWEEIAEKAVFNVLEQAEWNFKEKNVGLYINGNYESTDKFASYPDFFSKLIEIAEVAFLTSLPRDQDSYAQQKESFDANDLVNSSLNDYQDNLKQLGWI